MAGQQIRRSGGDLFQRRQHAGQGTMFLARGARGDGVWSGGGDHTFIMV